MIPINPFLSTFINLRCGIALIAFYTEEGNAGYLPELRKKLAVEQSINGKMSAINKFKLAANIAYISGDKGKRMKK
ncbi:hypothetical protein [Tolypothrix sp. VBCCA 56010]|uniref:hypothetical protein n=1 Tax=Tolypothrix sp. VBCCA 56010 TaxID=3137731 RepID=UPI003D7F0D63